MSRRQTEARPIHLLEFGLRWPADTFIAAKLERLAARGFRVTVACPDSPPRPVAGIPGIRIEPVVPAGRTSVVALVAALSRLAVARPGRLGAVVRAAFAPRGNGQAVGRREALGRLRTYARLASLRPDVVQFEWNTTAVHFHSLVDALGCPAVVSVRGGDLEVYPHTRSTRALAAGYPAAFRRAAAVHCVSEAAAAEAPAQGMRPDKATVIRPAVDTSRFRPRPVPPVGDDTFRVVGIGWLHWRKGWEYALQSIALLAAEGVPVAFDVVGGDAPSEQATSSDGDRIRAVAAELGLTTRVVFHGRLDHDGVRRLLERADALLHMSLAEGIPNVVLEAMAAGVAVVATDVGGTSEVLTDGVEGFLVEPRDPAAAADALRTLWLEPERRRAVGLAARARVEAEAGLEQQADRWVELYEQVTKTAAPARGLRLVEVGTAWPPEPFLQRKLQGLAERHDEVVVASILAPGERPTWVAGLRLEALPHWKEPRYRLLFGVTKDTLVLLARDPRRLRAVARTLRRTPPRNQSRWRVARLRLSLARLRSDLVHIEWASLASTCEPLFAVWNVPVVVSCHGSEVLVEPSTGRSVELAPVFQRVDAVHCASRAVARAAEAHGLDPSRARVIPSAVEPNVFRPSKRRRSEDGEFAVVVVATLRWVKGHEYALGAVARLAAAGVPIRLEIAGAEPLWSSQGERPRILALARDLDLLERIRLHGSLSEPEVVRLLQQADAFLQASLSEGMPTALLEAMACGLPVVATDVGGTREVLTDGIEGFLIPPRSPDAAAEALHRLWRDPVLRGAMGRAGRARVAKNLTVEQQLDGFQALYGELAGA